MKTSAISLALAMAALTLTPTAHADMLVGNYRLDTNRDPGHSWILAIRPCPHLEPGCLQVQGVPTPNGQAAPWKAAAALANGR